MTPLEVIDLPADRLPGKALAVVLFEDQRPLDGPAAVVDWRLDGLLTRMILDGQVTGKSGELLALQANAKFAAPWVLLVGGGRWRFLDRDDYLTLTGRLLKVAAKAGMSDVSICLPPSESVDASEVTRIVQEALIGFNHLEICRLSRVARFD